MTPTGASSGRPPVQPQVSDRRLTTILAADVVGYSRLMGDDEAGTLATIKSHRNELIAPKATQYHGRIIKLIGDGVLMEFVSVVDAVAFAVEVQCAMQRRNAEVSEERRIRYRVGINIGDIIVEGDDIYGDGVNIAARLEGLADPGGLCVARNVYNQVKGKLDLDFVPLGEQKVKNIAEPISVYSVILNDKAQALLTEVSLNDRSRRRNWLNAGIAFGLGLAAIALGITWLEPWSANLIPDVVAPITLPETKRPSLVVLPFVNLSGDSSQEYFAEGITDDLTTDLSKLPGVFVIARNSAYKYKGQHAAPRTIANDLGVKYILQGSVRRSSDRVKINAQLINVASEENIWAERFNRSFSDLFDLQESVVREILSALVEKIQLKETLPIAEVRGASPFAYDLFLRGQQLARTADYAQARIFYQEAIASDPSFARAYSGLSVTYTISVVYGWSKEPQSDLSKALALARKAVMLGGGQPQTQWALAFAYLYHRDFPNAQAALRQAITLDPSYADAYALLAHIGNLAGEPRQSLEYMRRARLFDPYLSAPSLDVLAISHYLLGEYATARDILKESLERNSEHVFSRIWLVTTLVRLGELEEAEWEFVELETMSPDFSIQKWTKAQPFRDQNVVDALLHDFSRVSLK